MMTPFWIDIAIAATAGLMLVAAMPLMKKTTVCAFCTIRDSSENQS